MSPPINPDYFDEWKPISWNSTDGYHFTIENDEYKVSWKDAKGEMIIVASVELPGYQVEVPNPLRYFRLYLIINYVDQVYDTLNYDTLKYDRL